MTKPFGKVQLKIIAALGTSIRPSAHELRVIELDVISVLEKYGLVIETEEIHGVVYKSILFSFESCP